MKFGKAFARLLLLLPWAASLKAEAQVAPVKKVVEMMTSLLSKCEKQMVEEQETFEKYKTWVQGRWQELGYEIEDGQEKVEELEQAVEQGEASVEKLTQEIADLNKDIGKAEEEKAEAKEVFEIQHAEFVILQKDQKTSADALQRAITEMQSSPDSAQAGSLLQQGAQDSDSFRPALTAYLRDSGYGSPSLLQLASSAGQSSLRKKGQAPKTALELMKALREKFLQERLAADREEAAKEKEYKSLMNSLDIRITRSRKTIEGKTISKDSMAADLTKDKSDNDEAKEALAKAEKFLRDVNVTWKVKSLDFQRNQEVRRDENEALRKAIEVMSQASQKKAAPDQNASAEDVVVTFLQLGHTEDLRQAASESLAASSQHASRVTAAGPLSKVIELVRDLRAQKSEELVAMQTKKAWCDTEMALNEAKLSEHGDAVKELSANLEDKEGKLGDMKDELQKLAEEQADLAEALAKAVTQRQREEADNKAALEEARSGQEAVNEAMRILNGFYGRDVVSFVQATSKQTQAPAMEAYTGMGSQSKGVMAMLEVIQTDFSRLEAETSMAEKKSKREYEELSEDCQASASEKSVRQEHVRRKVNEFESEVSAMKEDLATSEEELKQAKVVAEQLKTTCGAKRMSYEERQQKREEEIASLREAQEALKEQSGN